MRIFNFILAVILRYGYQITHILGSLNDSKFYDNLNQFSDETRTTYWKNRYAVLLVLQNKQIHIKNKFAKLFLNDSHRFVRFKAKEIST